MFSSHSPAAPAAEFPNDNPLLHHGARWVCRETLGVARAVVRASAEGVRAVVSLPQSPPPALAAESSAPARRYDGPLELDLDRIVIAHRVEDIPPPPDFIFRPFVRKPAPAAREVAPVAPPIRPLPCRVIDEHAARVRVARSGSVDVAPCSSVEEAAPPPALPAVERTRRSRRRSPVAARVLAVAAIPDRSELQRAIAELEAAFAKPALHSRPHEGARVSQCRAGAV